MKSISINIQSLYKKLEDLPLGGILFKPRMSSTNNVALDWASRDAQDMSLVITNHQTDGRGRKNHKWLSSPYSSLTFSLILSTVSEQKKDIGKYSALGAMAVVNALHKLDPRLDFKIKWPNDVLVNRRKISGVLAEAVWLGDEIENIVIGIGINMDNEAIPHPDMISFPASSLESELGFQVDGLNLLHGIIKELLVLREKIRSDCFIQIWEDLLEYRDELVEVWEDGRQPEVGKIAGLAQNGGLRLMKSDGLEVLIHVGDMHLRPSADPN